MIVITEESLTVVFVSSSNFHQPIRLELRVGDVYLNLSKTTCVGCPCGTCPIVCFAIEVNSGGAYSTGDLITKLPGCALTILMELSQFAALVPPSLSPQ